MDLNATVTPDTLRAAGWSAMEDDGFIGLVGPIWHKRSAEGANLGFIAETRHQNRAGVVQGGMLATLADRTLGLAVRRDELDRSQATINLDINYLDAARIGEFVEARATVLRQTSNLAFVTGQIDVDGRIVASINGIWRIRPGVKISRR